MLKNKKQKTQESGPSKSKIPVSYKMEDAKFVKMCTLARVVDYEARARLSRSVSIVLISMQIRSTRVIENDSNIVARHARRRLPESVSWAACISGLCHVPGGGRAEGFVLARASPAIGAICHARAVLVDWDLQALVLVLCTSSIARV